MMGLRAKKDATNSIDKIIKKKLFIYFGSEVYNKYLALNVYNASKGTLTIESNYNTNIKTIKKHYLNDMKEFCELLWPEEEININFKSNQIKSSTGNVITPVFNNGCSFENFVTDSSNSIAFNMIKGILHTNGLIDTSEGALLYINASTGLGKTHLLKALLKEANTANKKALYYSSELFLSSFVSCIRNNKFFEFKDKINNADILMIDDFHNLINKKKTFETLSSTITNLLDQNKIVILTSSEKIGDLNLPSEEIRSRLLSSVFTSITKPTTDLKQKVASLMTTKQNLKINNNTIHFIANNISSGGIRGIKGAIQRLKLSENLYNNNDLCSIKALLSDLINENDTERKDSTNNCSKENKKNKKFDKKSFACLKRSVSIFFRVSKEDLESKSRNKNIAYIRNITMYLCYDFLNMPYQLIADEFKRSHSSVYSICNKLMKNKQEHVLSHFQSIKRIMSTMNKL